MTETKDVTPAPDQSGADGDEQTVAQIWDQMEKDEAATDGGDDAPDPAAFADDDSDFPGETSEEGDAPADGQGAPDGQTPDPAADEAAQPSTQELLAQIQALTHKVNSMHGRLKTKDRDRTAAKREKLQGSLQELKTRAQDYPDLLNPSIEVFEALVDNEGHAPTPEEIAAEETATFRTRHPDFDAMIARHGTDFAAWIDQQPQEVRDVAIANKDKWVDGDAAADLFDSFKAHLRQQPKPPPPNPLDQKRQRQQAGAIALTSRAPSTEPDGGDDWAHWERVDRAKGRT